MTDKFVISRMALSCIIEKHTYVFSGIIEAFTEQIRDMDGHRYSFFLDIAESAVTPRFHFEARRWPYSTGKPY
jgi:hypothetical protein